MAITDASLKRTFTGTKALAVLSLIPACLVLSHVKGEFADHGIEGNLIGYTFVFLMGMVLTIAYGWLAMILGLLTPAIAGLFNIADKKIILVLTIIYGIIFCLVSFTISYYVTYMFIGDDYDTMMEVRPAMLVASLIVASIQSGLFKALLTK